MIPNLKQDKNYWINRATALAWFTILYNILEATFAIGYGMKEEAIALAGFGLDSLIEVASATLVLWRFKGESNAKKSLSLEKERKATLGIGWLFLFLASTSSLAAMYQLSQGQHPNSTMPGTIIALVSLSIMIFLWKAKIKVATNVNSSTIKKDADCSLACIKLSIILLLGSVLHSSFPSMWWADGGAALIISFFIGKEGWDTVKDALSKHFSGGCNPK